MESKAQGWPLRLVFRTENLNDLNDLDLNDRN